MRRGEGNVLIHAAGVVVLCFHGRADMRVNPERPESVVQIERDEFREREAVCKGRRQCGGILQGLGVLSFRSDHIHIGDWAQEAASGGLEKGEKSVSQNGIKNETQWRLFLRGSLLVMCNYA